MNANPRPACRHRKIRPDKGLFTVAEHNPLPLQSRALEVEDHADLVSRDPKIIEHLATLMIRDSLDDLGVDYHAIEC